MLVIISCSVSFARPQEATRRTLIRLKDDRSILDLRGRQGPGGLDTPTRAGRRSSRSLLGVPWRVHLPGEIVLVLGGRELGAWCTPRAGLGEAFSSVEFLALVFQTTFKRGVLESPAARLWMAQDDDAGTACSLVFY